MKKIIFTLFALAAALPQAIAQEADLTRATVDVDEGRLESLLTDAQKQAVRHQGTSPSPARWPMKITHTCAPACSHSSTRSTCARQALIPYQRGLFTARYSNLMPMK